MKVKDPGLYLEVCETQSTSDFTLPNQTFLCPKPATSQQAYSEFPPSSDRWHEAEKCELNVFVHSLRH